MSIDTFRDNKPTSNEDEFISENLENKQSLPSVSNSGDFPESSPAKRMSITLAREVFEYLEKWAKAEHVSINEIIRRAISTELFLQKEIRSGSKLLIHGKNNEIKEIIFR